MRELLTEHWHIIDGSLTTLVNAIARLIADEVRMTTQRFSCSNKNHRTQVYAK